MHPPPCHDTPLFSLHTCNFLAARSQRQKPRGGIEDTPASSTFRTRESKQLGAKPDETQSCDGDMFQLSNLSTAAPQSKVAWLHARGGSSHPMA